MKDTVSAPNKSPADKPAQIDAAGRLFLWGFRMMAEHRGCDHPTLPVIKDGYRRFGIEAATPLIDALVDAHFHTAHTPITIHSAGCPCLSEDEAFLLQAMTSAQSRDPGAAQRQFERWLPALAAEWVMGPVAEIGRVFRAAGLFFRTRDADRTELAQFGEQNWPIASRAMH